MDMQSLITYFDRAASSWEQAFPPNPERLRTLATLSCLAPGMRILDAACGTGPMIPFLLKYQPAAVLGVDISPLMLEQARSKQFPSQVELRCCDIMSLSGEEFDCAFVNNAFPYFENRGSLIRQMHHLLKPGGRVVISHTSGRAEVNSQHQTGMVPLMMPLPATHTLAGTISQYFDVDMQIDSPEFYVVSGIRR